MEVAAGNYSVQIHSSKDYFNYSVTFNEKNIKSISKTVGDVTNEEGGYDL